MGRRQDNPKIVLLYFEGGSIHPTIVWMESKGGGFVGWICEWNIIDVQVHVMVRESKWCSF